MDDNRPLKLLLVLIAVAVASYGGYYQLVGKNNTAASYKDDEAADKMVDHLLETKFMGATKIEITGKYFTVTVDPRRWNDMSKKQKELMLVSFWQANALSARKQWVEIKDESSGRILGKFRPSDGLVPE